MQDSSDSRIKELLEFDCVTCLKTVHSLLSKKEGLELLSDPLIEKATTEIVAGDKARYEVRELALIALFHFHDTWTNRFLSDRPMTVGKKMIHSYPHLSNYLREGPMGILGPILALINSATLFIVT